MPPETCNIAQIKEQVLFHKKNFAKSWETLGFVRILDLNLGKSGFFGVKNRKFSNYFLNFGQKDWN